MRKKRRWGADHIAFEVGVAASTVQAILNREGLGRLDRGDRATNREPVRRYQRDRPGELVHIDVKKLSGIPDGGGWRIHTRGHAPTVKRSTVGYRFIHFYNHHRSHGALGWATPASTLQDNLPAEHI